MNAAPKLPPMMTVNDFLDWPGDGTGTKYDPVDGVLRAHAVNAMSDPKPGRDDKGNWPEPGEIAETGGVIRLASIGLEMPVGDVYWGTVFGE